MGQHVQEMLTEPTVPNIVGEKADEITEELLKHVRRNQSSRTRGAEIISHVVGPLDIEQICLIPWSY